MTDLRQAADPVADAVAAARAEQTTLAALDGRRWFTAPGEWMEYATARMGRRASSALVGRAGWDQVAARDIGGGLDRYQVLHESLRNPFHPGMLSVLDEVVAFVLERRGVRDAYADVVETLPPLAERLSAEGIERYIRAEIARRQAIASDPVLLVHHQEAELDTSQAHRAGEQWLTVQHPASGLRARFMYHPDKPEGRVYSRGYGIDSIDPTRVEDPEDRAPRWREYTGLGIGTRIYLRGAQELPGVRWGATSVSAYAEPLRSKLHKLDPWRWRSRACTCYAVWSELTERSSAEASHRPVTSEDA
ncbi:hypothetical protein C8K30_1011125 [Promicromonospora sp. AC04]|uniref:hypothetical protein n=1 Tax=Promicromonospora sp. AC04 TaxID=2135723 RepID=UPI000D3CCB03|nr:hypothetical protein [Promicromonospora sp. AC04]PUB32599.1 hypothetical protein C8K30_1011125 [Promicromonospora sp. AC04]